MTRSHITELELKIRINALRRLVVVGDCTYAWVENDTRSARSKRCAHGLRICPFNLHHTPEATWAVFALQDALQLAATIIAMFTWDRTYHVLSRNAHTLDI